MDIITTATSVDEAERAAKVAVLPVGSFEQHGAHLPLSTDTLVAGLIAKHIAETYNLFLLPPITITCSQEHVDFSGTVSISSATLHSLITDIAVDLARAGVNQLVLVNGHGGNYVLSNIVQEANASRGSGKGQSTRMTLFPGKSDWDRARLSANLSSTSHDDMHGGEAETSLLLSTWPHLVRDGWKGADHQAPVRPHLLLLGMAAYTDSGIIGTPSASSASKGAMLLESLGHLFREHLDLLGS